MRSAGACSAVALLLACENAAAPAGSAPDASIASLTDAPLSGSDSTNDADDVAEGRRRRRRPAMGPGSAEDGVRRRRPSACLTTSDQCADARWLLTYFNGACVAGDCRF
jgi:hypothetical protein